MTIEMTYDWDGNLCQAIARLFGDFLPVSSSPRSPKSWPFSRDYAGHWLMPLTFLYNVDLGCQRSACLHIYTCQDTN